MEAGPSERALDLLADALERDAARREAFVAEACADDEPLRAEVLALLAHERAASGFLETPAFVLDDGGPLDSRGELKPGDTLGDCTVIRLLGEGGMGEVYLAEDMRLERQVAVKLLKRHLGNDALLRRFRHERKVLAGLTHPNIARLYGGAVAPEGRSYLVMEYVEGERLDRSCDSHALDVSARLALFRKVCAAVTYAHQNLIVHRDLKPANILVTAEGEPKLLDFGIAKLLDPDATAGTDLTVTMFGALTPEYASPEQLKGEAITTATDVYSLGVILYELLAGQRPFQPEHGRADLLSRAICEQEPPRPSTVRGQTARDAALRLAGLPPDKLRQRLAGDLDNIVAMAMRKDPLRRYASAAQFSEDIRRHCEGLPVFARPDTFTYRASKFVRRNKLGAALVTLVVFTLIAGLIATTWESRRAARRFEDVRRLANSILFEIEPKIANVTGATEARSLLAKRALEYLDNLSLEAGGNRELRRELAASYERVGDVQGNPAGPNLGDLKGAMASYGKARALRESLVAAAPHDAWARHELANNEEQLGTIRWWTNDTPGALILYGEALTLRRALLAEIPGSPDFRQGFASVQIRLADVATSNGENARALDDLQQALPILQQLAQGNPHDTMAQIEVARCLARIGLTQHQTGNYPAAYEALDRAQAIVEPITRREPDNRLALVQYCYELTVEDETYNDDNTPGTTAKVLALCPRLIAMTQVLAGKDKDDTTVQHNLCIAYYDYAIALLHAGRWPEVVDQAQLGLEVNTRMAAKDVENGESLHTNGYLHSCRAEARMNLGQLDDALNDIKTSQQNLETLVAKDPENFLMRRELVGVRMLRGKIETQRHEPAAARQSFQQALSALETITAGKPIPAWDAEDLDFLRKALAGTPQ